MGQVHAGCGGTQGKSWGQQAEGGGPESQMDGAAGDAGEGWPGGQGQAASAPPGRAPPLDDERRPCLHSLTADPSPFHRTHVVHGNDSGEPWACRVLVTRPGIRARDLSSPIHLLPLTHAHSGPRSSRAISPCTMLEVGAQRPPQHGPHHLGRMPTPYPPGLSPQVCPDRVGSPG